MQSLRIIHVLPSLEMGGMERMVAELARASAIAGHHVTVLCTSAEGQLAPAVRGSGVRVHLVTPASLLPWVGKGALADGIKRAGGADVLHSHSGIWWRSAIAAWTCGVPVHVHTMHGINHQDPWWIPAERWLSSMLTARVVGVSEGVCRHLREECLIQSAKVQCIENGVDVDRFAAASGAEWRGRLGIREDTVLFGSVSRMVPVKNLTLALNALAAVVQNHQNVHFAMAGGGSERGSLEALVEALDLGDHVHFVGELMEPAEFFAALDGYVLCSRSEGTPLALLEAMAAGRCCIATAVGGCPEVLVDGAAGILVPDDDLVQLTRQMESVATNETLRRAFGDLARQRVLNRYSSQVMVTEYHRLYATLLAS